MATTFIEPSGDADFAVADAAGLGFWSSITGTPAVATDFVRGTHVKSIKLRPANIDYIRKDSIIADTGSRINYALYLNALPTSSTASIVWLLNSSNNIVISLRMTSAGVLRIYDSANNQIGSSGSHTLSTGSWYRISIAYTITSTTVNRIEVLLDGSSDISITNATIASTGTANLSFVNNNDATLDTRISDVYVDDSSALTDPGNIWVTIKRPVSNGTLVEFTTQIGVGGSGYGTGHTPQENERPFSATNGWRVSNTTRVTEEYTIEAASVGDIDMTGGTLIDMMGFIVASVNSTADSPVHRIIIGGVTFAKTLTTGTAIYTQIAGSSTYPAGGTDIGIDAQFTTTPHQTRFYETGLIMAFIPSSGSSIKTVNGLAIASVKTVNGLAIASVKTINGLT